MKKKIFKNFYFDIKNFCVWGEIYFYDNIRENERFGRDTYWSATELIFWIIFQFGEFYIGKKNKKKNNNLTLLDFI